MDIPLFLKYCLKNEYLTRDQFVAFIERHRKPIEEEKDKDICKLIMLELGWDKDKIRTVMKKFLESSNNQNVGRRTTESTVIVKKKGKRNTEEDDNKTTVVGMKKTGESSEENDGESTVIVKKKGDAPGAGLSGELQNNPGIHESQEDGESSDEERSFGKYILVKKLGAGGMGVVYKAYHPKLKSHFALKMIRSTEEVSSEEIQRFEREARLAFTLKHPNIVQVHDVGVEDGKNYIVMDYIEGEDLGHLIKEGSLTPRRSFEITLAIARALQYSHEHGVIHRDIKPSNIMITNREGRETPYLMDFGLASTVKEKGLTRSGQIIGTPKYMSPEQTMGLKSLDGRSDIYSLGAIIYEILTGESVVKADTLMSIIYEVVNKYPPLISQCVPSIAKDVEAITMKCLEKEPSRRYQNAGELADDIERYLRGEVVTAHTPGRFERFRRKMRLNWKLSVIIACVVLLSLGIAIISILRSYAHAKEENEKNINSLILNAESQKDIKGAAALYLSILTLDPGNLKAQQSLDKIKRDIMKEALDNETKGEIEKVQELYEYIFKLDSNYQGIDECMKRIRTKEKKSREGRKNALKLYYKAMEVFWNPNLNKEEIRRCRELFKEASEKDPSFADAYFQAGRASQRIFENEKAINYYKKSSDLDKDKKLTAPRYYLTTLVVPLKFQEVVKEFRLSSSTTEGVMLQYYTLKIEEEFNKIWYEGNTSTQTWEADDQYLVLAKAQLLLTKLQLFIVFRNFEIETYKQVWKECKDNTEKVIKSSPDFSDAYFLKAQLNSYLMAIRKETRHRYGIYIKEIDSPDLEMALYDCTKGIHFDPLRADGYNLRGAIYKSIGDYRSAEFDFTQSIRFMGMDLPGVYCDRAICYMSIGRYDLALKDIDEEIKVIENTKEKRKNGDNKEPLGESEPFLYRAILKCCMGDKIGAKSDLEIYFSAPGWKISWRDIGIAKFDYFINALVSIHIYDDMEIIKNLYSEFIRCNKPIFILLQGLFISLDGVKSKERLLENTLNIIQSRPNIFCVSPDLKIMRKQREFINILSFLKDKKDSMHIDEEFNVVMRVYLDNLESDPKLKEKHRIVNLVFQKECHPITLDFLIYLLYNFGEQKKFERMLNWKKLPSAELYYRRAVEHYLNNDNLNKDKQREERIENLESARKDLEEALELDPNFMNAHYGLSTVYSILCRESSFSSEQIASFRNLALFHLKQAIETGWGNLESYTLKDEDFSGLGLENKSILEKVLSWHRERTVYKKEIEKFREKIEDYVSIGKTKIALLLLYNSRFSSRLKPLVDSTEKKVMEEFLDKREKMLRESEEMRKNSKEPEIDKDMESKKQEIEELLDREIEKLFGEKGAVIWRWAKWAKK